MGDKNSSTSGFFPLSHCEHDRYINISASQHKQISGFITPSGLYERLKVSKPKKTSGGFHFPLYFASNIHNICDHILLFNMDFDFNDWEYVTAEDAEEVKEYIVQNGVSNIRELLKEKLDRWQEAEVNIGITGDSGAGKSSYINAIRG